MRSIAQCAPAFVLALALSGLALGQTVSPDAWQRADERARATESQMTDDERFALLISLSGATRFTGGVRDTRYPNDPPLTAGYTPGVPRLGVPVLLSSDASMGVTL